MHRYLLVFAMSVAFVASSVSLAHQQTTESLPYNVRSMTDRVAGGVVSDLALSVPQRTVWMDMIIDYRNRFAKADASRRDADAKWAVGFWLDLVPELDEAVDLSDWSDEDRAEVIELRRQWKDGQPPYERQSFGDTMRRGLRMWESEDAMFRIERDLRRKMLDQLQLILHEVQRDRWPLAMRRITVNMQDHVSSSDRSDVDPAWKVDLLAMLRQATEEDAELHAFAEAIRSPDIVLMDDRAVKANRELAERILRFEHEYAIVLKDSDWKLLQVAHKRVRHRARGEREAAEKEWDQSIGLKRRVWNVRLRFVEDLGNLAGTLLGDTEREAWGRRWRERFCPTLYLDESTDMLYRFILQLDDIDEDMLTSINEIHAAHLDWRDRFKARMVRLEIDHSLLARRDRNEGAKAQDLPEAHETRLKRATRINQSMRVLLPPEHRERFDQLVRRRPQSQVYMGGRFVQVRP